VGDTDCADGDTRVHVRGREWAAGGVGGWRGAEERSGGQESVVEVCWVRGEEQRGDFEAVGGGRGGVWGGF
jgi:hypothetical protein